MANARILIAEDEAIVALDIKQMLERQGYVVPAIVSSARAAIEKTGQTQPDLVLMDIALQGELSGLDAADQIWTQFEIPVIFLTAHADAATAQKAKRTKPFGYILKPWKDREVQLAIELALNLYAMELRLREREQWLAATLSSINDAVVTTDQDGAVTFMNSPAEAVTGWRQDEALGRHWQEVLTLADPQTLTPLRISLSRAVEESQAGELHNSVVMARDGTPTLVDANVTSIRDEAGMPLQGFVLSFQDTGERRDAERGLRESEERLRSLCEETPIGIFQISPDGRIIEGNPALVHMLGYASLAELKQHGSEGEAYASDLSRSDTRRRIEEQGEIIGHESSWRRKDGSTIIVRENVRAVRDRDENVLYYEGTAEDITEHRLTQVKLERRAAQLALLNNIGERIATTLELDTILDTTTQLVQESLGCHRVALFMLDPERDEAVLRASAGDFAGVPVLGHRQTLGDGIIGWVVRHGETLLVEDVEADPRYVKLAPEASPTHSGLSVPIQIRGEVAGVLDVQSPQINAFDSGDVMVMEMVADQIALALSRGQLHQGSQKRSERLAVLNTVSSAVFSSLEPETVMRQILSVTRQAFGAPEGSILLCDFETGELFFELTSPREQGGDPVLEGMRLKPGQGIAGWVVEHDQAVLVDDVRSDPRWYGGVDDITGFQTRSLMSAPLKRRGEIIGTIEIVSPRRAAFTGEDLSLLQALCSIAAIGLDNARLYAAMRSHADRLALLHQVGQALSSTLDYDVVINAALAKMQELFPADGIWFFEAELGTDELRLVGALTEGASGDSLVKAQSAENVAACAVEHGEPVIVSDVLADPRLSGRLGRDMVVQTRAMMAVPLVTTDRIIGAVVMSSGESEAYDRSDLNMLQAVASTMSVALENARLYENLKTLLREREEAEARLIQSEKMAALGRLLATITHEVNNPLQAIEGCLTLAQEEMEGRQRPQKLSQYLQVARTEIEHIADIVRRTRAFYRPDVGGPRAVDVQVVLESVLNLSDKELQYSDIVVECDWADGLPKIVVNGDQLRQVFLNLVLNAIDAMPTGGTLRVGTSLDHMSVGGDGQVVPVVRIQFSDTGEGIPEGVEPHVFEPFVTSKEHGTGLGLFITYGVIQAHGGEITAASRPGEGTTFTILLPVESEQGDAHDAIQSVA
jgi:PAS domain S-box-containing protein